jgi:hypothetical protein
LGSADIFPQARKGALHACGIPQFAGGSGLVGQLSVANHRVSERLTEDLPWGRKRILRPNLKKFAWSWSAKDFLKNKATFQIAFHGHHIPPQQQILLYSDSEWEGFVHEWAHYCLKTLYAQVQRFAGSGDRGIDIAGFTDADKSATCHLKSKRWSSRSSLACGHLMPTWRTSFLSSPSFLLRLFHCYQARLKLRQFERLCENFDKPGYLARFSRRQFSRRPPPPQFGQPLPPPPRQVFCQPLGNTVICN